MGGIKVGLIFLTCAVLFFCGASCNYSKHRAPDEHGFIDWKNLKNPVYDHTALHGQDWSTKDACMAYKDGCFYVFFSAFFGEDGRERSHVSCVKTKDFKTFSRPLFLWSGKRDGWIGMCSPNIIKAGNLYYLTYNSWGDKKGKVNQLFYAVSNDLEHWQHNLPLARNITDGVRAIDAAVAYHNGKFYLAWKENQTPQFAVARKMGPDSWTRLGSSELGWYENAQFIEIDQQWYMIAATDQGPGMSRMAADGNNDKDWVNWDEFRYLDIKEENFNTRTRANAGFLADWRNFDGYFYFLYAGTTENESHAGRGDNRLGLARSKDLEDWRVP
jgi:hypothetical protein